jgi:hypothetical protein
MGKHFWFGRAADVARGWAASRYHHFDSGFGVRRFRSCFLIPTHGFKQLGVLVYS